MEFNGHAFLLDCLCSAIVTGNDRVTETASLMGTEDSNNEVDNDKI